MRRRVIASLVVLYVLAADTWIFYQGSLLNTLRQALLVGIPIALLVLSRGIQLPRFVRALLVGVWIAFMWAVIVTFFNEGSLTAALLVLKNFAVFGFLLGAVAATRDRSVRLATMRALFWLGAVLSAQAVALFLLFVFHRTPSSHSIFLLGSAAQPENSFGVFGFANAVVLVNSPAALYRAQSWFPEPSSMALFLEATLAFGLVTLRNSGHRRRHIAGLVATALSLFITFSTAMEFAGIAALAMLAVVLMLKRYDYMTRLGAAVAALAIGCALILPTIRVLNDIYGRDLGRVSFALGKAPGQSSRFYQLSAALDFVGLHPQGAGFAALAGQPAERQLSDSTASAPMTWGIFLGIPGLALALIFFFAVLGLAIRATSRAVPLRILGVALAAQTLHQISAGSWKSATFLLFIAFVSWELEPRPRQSAEVVAHQRVRGLSTEGSPPAGLPASGPGSHH